MAIPDFQTLMLPLLIRAAVGVRTVAEIETEIADELALTLEERERLLPSGKQTTLRNRLNWAKYYLTRAGLLQSPARGQFVVTDAGRQLLATHPVRVDAALLSELSASFQDFLRPSKSSGDPAENGDAPPVAPSAAALGTPEEQIDAAHRALHAALISDLLQRIWQNTPGFFERLIVDLLLKMGYGGNHADAARQLGRSGDGGVDGVVNEDRLGLDRLYIQAKRYALDNNVGRPDVQGFLGSLVGHGASKGVFVTTSGFSQQARDFVRHLPQRIVLIDGTTLAALMIEHGVGVRTNRTIEFKKLDEDFFSEDD